MAVITRQNIDHLTPDALARLRRGYTAIQALSDNRGYNSIAGFHSVPLHLCYHHEDPLMFLPWHRGYLFMFENLLQDQDSQLALPYWDWASPTSHAHGVPAAFKRAKQSDGQRNPLFNSFINVPTVSPPQKRFTRRFPGDPGELPTSDEVQDALRESNYVNFANQIQDIHDGVHGWTGGQSSSGVPGDMALVPFAAYDPIFFSHHCMIDRLWDRWQQIHGLNNIPSSILNRPLRGFDNLTVASVLDISQLGYSYASDEIVLDDHT